MLRRLSGAFGVVSSMPPTLPEGRIVRLSDGHARESDGVASGTGRWGWWRLPCTPSVRRVVRTLTENARPVVQDITHQPGLPDTAGLRISSEEAEEPTFAVSAAEAPEPGDQTIEQDGATVYLDPSAA